MFLNSMADRAISEGGQAFSDKKLFCYRRLLVSWLSTDWKLSHQTGHLPDLSWGTATKNSRQYRCFSNFQSLARNSRPATSMSQRNFSRNLSIHLQSVGHDGKKWSGASRHKYLYDTVTIRLVITYSAPASGSIRRIAEFALFRNWLQKSLFSCIYCLCVISKCLL